VNDQRLRVGVIGTGYGTAVHVPGLQHLPEVEVAAICANHLDHAKQAAHRFRISEYYRDYREMIRRCALDAVTVAVPPHAQHQVVVGCLEAGLHVLCEKPMGTTAAEARDMHRLAQDSGNRHAVNYQTRYTPTRRRFKDLVSKGYIGSLQSVTVTGCRVSWMDRRLQDPNWIDEGERAAGLLNAIGSEHVDTLRWCFGDFEGVAGAVTIDRSSRGRRGIDTSFSMVLRFRSGAAGTVHVTGNAPVGLGEEIVASGDEGMLVLQADGRLYGTRRDEHRVEELPVPGYDRTHLPDFPHPRMLSFIVMASDWVRGILTGDRVGMLPSFEDGMRVQEVLHGVQRSEALSRWIDLSGKKWPVQI
jgi:predicted dehydrogenase